MTAKKTIRFPKQCYVGVIARADDTYPLGFMTEYGTDKAAEKRMATVRSWMANAWRAEKTKAEPVIYDNKPLTGFRLVKSIRRNSDWGQGNVKWRIEDPRGFELEITSPNMANILADAVIEHGEILQDCLWARCGGDNVLVPVESDVYRDAKTNSERLEKSVKPSTVKPGNRIILKNGVEGIYYGKYFPITRPWTRTDDCIQERIIDKVRHVIFDGKTIHSVASFKPVEILDSTEISMAEAEKSLNALDNSGLKEWFIASSVDLGRPRAEPYVDNPKTADTTILAYLNGDPTPLVFSGVTEDYSRRTATGRPVKVVRFYKINHSRWENESIVEYTMVKSSSYGYYSRNIMSHACVDFDETSFSWDNVRMEALYYEFTTALGNTLKVPYK